MGQTEQSLVWPPCLASRAAGPYRASPPGWGPSGCSPTCLLLRRIVPGFLRARPASVVVSPAVSPTRQRWHPVRFSAMPPVFAWVSRAPSGPSRGTASAGFSGLMRRVHSASRFPKPSIPPLLSAMAVLACLLLLVWPSRALNFPEPLQQPADTASWNSHRGVATGGSVSPHQLMC